MDKNNAWLGYVLGLLVLCVGLFAIIVASGNGSPHPGQVVDYLVAVGDKFCAEPRGGRFGCVRARVLEFRETNGVGEKIGGDEIYTMYGVVTYELVVDEIDGVPPRIINSRGTIGTMNATFRFQHTDYGWKIVTP